MYQKSSLPNGLRVVSHDMMDREGVSLGFWVGVGGRYEEDKTKGIAHFLEHIVFKGSKKYSCDEIKQLIEGVGGTLNAFTSEEQTCYYAKIPHKFLARTFDVLADMVFFPTVASKDVDKEKTVIIEEIKMYRDLPQYQVTENLDKLLWPDHPLGKNLAGTPETVSAISSKDLKGFANHFYSPSNVVISACGKVHHQTLLDLAKKKLNNLPRLKIDKYQPAGRFQKEPKTSLFYKKTEQMHLALGMLGYDENNFNRYILSLASIILGGNMSSRLFNEVREKRGLAYSISSFSKSLHDTGMFVVRAGVDNTKIIDAVGIILKELEKFRKKGVSESEFNRAKDYLIGQIQLALEDTMEQMLWFGESVVSKDRIMTLEEVVKSVEKVKRGDLKTIADEIMDPKRFNLAVVGPLNDIQKKKLDELVLN